MRMEGQSYTNPLQAAANKYLYNGKELQDDLGLNWYAYGFRFYDPVLGRFPSLDPIAEKFAHVSPYNYAENRPIDGIDLWGLQWTSVKDNKQEVKVEIHARVVPAIVRNNAVTTLSNNDKYLEKLGDQASSYMQGELPDGRLFSANVILHTEYDEEYTDKYTGEFVVELTKDSRQNNIYNII